MARSTTSPVQALGLDQEALAALLVATLRTFGVLGDDWRKVTAQDVTAKDLQVGDVIAVWGHQRIRAAIVWKVGRTRVSAVYVTPTEVEQAAKVRRGISWNNITESVERVGLLQRAGQDEAPAVEDAQDAVEGQDEAPTCGLAFILRRTTADPATCDAPATTTVRTLLDEALPACDEHAADYRECSGIVQPEAAPAGGSAGARAASVPAPCEDGGLFGLDEVSLGLF